MISTYSIGKLSRDTGGGGGQKNIGTGGGSKKNIGTRGGSKKCPAGGGIRTLPFRRGVTVPFPPMPTYAYHTSLHT